MLPPRPKNGQEWRCWDVGNFQEKSSEPRNSKTTLTWKEALVISCEQKCSKVKVGEEAYCNINTVYYLSNTDDISDKHVCKNAQLHILDSIPNFMLGKCEEEDFSSFDSLTSFDSWCFLSLASLDESWRVFIPLAIGSVMNHKWNAWFKMNTLGFCWDQLIPLK